MFYIASIIVVGVRNEACHPNASLIPSTRMNMKKCKQPIIDISLVKLLVSTQFPQWKDLAVRPVTSSGWDNRTFHLGDQMLIRMPSSAEYEASVEKEQYWLPKLAPLLPLPIPTPLALGNPMIGYYPWKWSIYNWLEGSTVASGSVENLCELAAALAGFLTALQRIDSTDGPLPGQHSFYRGGSLTTYDTEVRQALIALKGKMSTAAATKIWETALKTSWKDKPVWVHGDISASNLLIQDGKLSAVIDFGQMTTGDPACDLAIAWTLFKEESREAFRSQLKLDNNTWNRGRGWALWKALVVAAKITNPNNFESSQCWNTIDEIFKDQ
jgi:aminoglycoside phosphotransferase (APT) family kinase protein